MWRRDGVGWKRRTDAAGRSDALGEFAAEGLGEGDVALFEDAVEELGSWVSGCGGRWCEVRGTYDGVELWGPLDGHGCGGWCLCCKESQFRIAQCNGLDYLTLIVEEMERRWY
jgi:hypothetical protein